MILSTNWYYCFLQTITVQETWLTLKGHVAWNNLEESVACVAHQITRTAKTGNGLQVNNIKVAINILKMHSINMWIKVILELHLSFYLTHQYMFWKMLSPQRDIKLWLQETLAIHGLHIHSLTDAHGISKDLHPICKDRVPLHFFYTMLIVLLNLYVRPIFCTKVIPQFTI